MIGLQNILTLQCRALSIQLLLWKTWILPKGLTIFRSANANPSFFTVENRASNFFIPDSPPGPPNMAFHHIQSQRSRNSSTGNGANIVKNHNVAVVFHFRKSNIFKGGFTDLLYCTMQTMGRQNWLCFVHVFISAVHGTHGMIQTCFDDFPTYAEAQQQITEPMPMHLQTKYNWSMNKKPNLP